MSKSSIKDEIIILYNSGLTYSKIQKQLGCSKGTISYHLSKYKIEEKIVKSGFIDNIKINLPKTREEFNSLYFDRLSFRERQFFYNSFYKKENKGTSKNNVPKEYYRSKRLELKKEFVEYKGGKCEICGYSKCLLALHFHHTNPNIKDFNIGGSISYKRRKEIMSELDKCILVCANCHAEIHEENKVG